MPKDRRDDKTMDLLNWTPPKVTVEIEQNVAGCGDLANQIARTVAHALRETKLSRNEISGKMTTYLGRNVSREILDKWTSEASEANRIPFDAFIALVDATGATDLLGFAPEKFGFAVVPDKYRNIIELHEVKEHKRKVKLHTDQLSAHEAALLEQMRRD